MHFQGGGSCKTGDDCWERWLGGGEVFNSCSKMSSRRFLDSGVTALEGKGVVGNLNTLDSPIADQYNFVFFHYCSSDQWVGGQAASTELNNGVDDYDLYFQGHKIVNAIVDRLLSAGGITAEDGQVVPSLADAAQIVLVGDSAGGGGLAHNALWLYDYVNAAGVNIPLDRFLTVFDAGNGPPFEVDGFDSVQAKVEVEFDDVRNSPTVWNWFGGNAECAAYHLGPGANSPLDEWICGYSNHLFANHWRFPTMIREDLRDTLNGDGSLEWSQDAVEGFQLYRETLSSGARYQDTRHVAGAEGVVWYLGEWSGAADPFFSQATPEIPADLETPAQDGFTGISEESPPPAMVMFAPNCRQHDAANNNTYFTQKVQTDATWWHGNTFASFHDILVEFVNEPNPLNSSRDVWDWDTHDPRTWLDDTYAGQSDCDNDGAIAAADCNDGNASQQSDCDGDGYVAIWMGGTDCDDRDNAVGEEDDCDQDGESSLAFGAGGDCNDLDSDVGASSLINGSSENFIRADGRNACTDLEDNDCDGLIDCDENECAYLCTRLTAPPSVPALGPWSSILAVIVLMATVGMLRGRRVR